jgi:hypothetical protein
MSKIQQYLLCAAVLGGMWIPIPAQAQSCTTFLDNLENWLVTKPNGPGTYEIRFNMVTNRSDGKYASYLEGPAGTPGVLNYYPAHSVGGFLFPAYLQGTGTQYFSDRRYLPSGGVGFAWAPFASGATDQTKVTISLGNSLFGSQFGQVTITLLSWGNASSSFMPSCQNGLVYGFVDNTMVVMSLNEEYFPPIR